MTANLVSVSEASSCNCRSDEDRDQLLAEYGRTRDPIVENELIIAHQRLVLQIGFSLIRLYQIVNEPIEDIAQEGNIGLWKSIKGFDPSRGFCFSTYAARCIENAIRDHLDREVLEPYPAQDGKILKRESLIPSLDEPVNEDQTLGETIGTDGGLEDLELVIVLSEISPKLDVLIMMLSPQEQQVVILHDRQGLSYTQIGKRIGRTRQAAHIRHKSALEHLRTIAAEAGMQQWPLH